MLSLKSVSSSSYQMKITHKYDCIYNILIKIIKNK